MKIYIFAMHYPSLYKPYYDSQFVELLERGHDIQIFSVGQQGDLVTKKVQKYGLNQKTEPLVADSLRSTLAFLPGALSRMSQDLDSAAKIWQHVGALPPKTLLKHLIRAFSLPVTSPDLCVVHGHVTMRLVPWLKQVYTGTPLAMYYYGGVPPDAGAMDPDTAPEAFAPADVVFTCSRYAAEEAVERGCPPDRLKILPLSFDLEDFDWPGERTYRPRERLRLLSVGRLSAGKGYDVALRALARIAEVRPELEFRYQLVGHGPQRTVLERLISTLGLEKRVELLGGLPFETVKDLYWRCDALVVPSYSTSQWTETQGTVIQEAMLMGAVPITTRTGGVPDSIPDFLTKFQVQERSARALADAVDRIADLGEEDLRQLGVAGRRWVQERFDIETFTADFLKTVYTKCNRHMQSEVVPELEAR